MGFFTTKKRNIVNNAIGMERALFVVVDPADGTQKIEPDDGDFFVIENKGERRAFLFQSHDGSPFDRCAECSLGHECTDYSDQVCRRMLCGENNVCAKEYAFDSKTNKFEPLPDDDDRDPYVAEDNEDEDGDGWSDQSDESEDEETDAVKFQFVYGSDKGEDPVVRDEPVREQDPRDPEERARAWEARIRELNRLAIEEQEKADAAKRQASESSKRVKALRASIMELLATGSENYQSETPLFDSIEE